ncbi:MAG TPA: hypothetical protein VF960_02930 [Chloroflexota bacterium]
MEEDRGTNGEEQLAVGGVFDRRAGCLLLPFIPVRAAGALILTSRRIIFDPIFIYKLFARKTSIDLADVECAEVSGANVGVSVLELVTFGKNLLLKMRDGRSRTYRSMQADELADEINRAVERLRP